MPTVTLLEKLYGNFSIKTVEDRIQALFEGLEAKAKVEVTARSWIRVKICGEDEVAALSLVEKEFGLAPVDATCVKEGTVYRGKIVSSKKSDMDVYVDIGVLLPSPIDTTISLQHLQAQLVDGQKLPLKRIIKLFCLLDNLLLEILIKHKATMQNRFMAELSEKQISLFQRWIRSNLERVIVLGAFSQEVENAVEASGHFRDVVEVERLGMLEHAVICKLGTDAAGLIPKIGRRLPNVVLGVFSPREISRYTIV
jgi:hypothetical protein